MSSSITFSESLLQVNYRLGFAPQAFQAVVFSFFGSEDVYDYISEVQYQPACFRDPLAVKQLGSLLFQFIFNSLGNGRNLACIVAIADHEVIGDGCQLLNVQ